MKAADKSTRLNRRAVLTGAAAAAVPVPALAVPDDPIYAAIAARKATLAAVNGSPDNADVPLALIEADGEALYALVHMPPTTLAGVAAVLRHVVESEDRGEPLTLVYVEDDELTTAGKVLHRTLLTALERL